MTEAATRLESGSHPGGRPSGIKYISLWENSGYGIAARRYMQGLAGLGIPLTWTPMVVGSGWGLGYQPFLDESVGDPELDRYCNSEISYDTVIVHTVPEYFPRWVQLEPGKRVIGYTVWETEIIPKYWKPLLDSVDRLMVPCRWNREVFENCHVATPVSVIPHVVAKDGPRIENEADDFHHPEIRPSDFVFYSINSWTPRKALWKTLEAYLEAFSADDPVLLLLKTSKENFAKPKRFLPPRLVRRRYENTRKTCRRIMRRHRNPARVLIVDQELSDQEIVGLHQRGGCYVSLCRTEGWGIGAFDACFYGNPVIMTGFGGQLDYLPDSAACLVRYELVPVDYHAHLSSYTPDQHWAEPDIAEGSRWMRHIFENQDEARMRGMQLRQNVTEHFAMDKVCRQMYQQTTNNDQH